MNNYCAIDTEVVETEFIEESLARVSVIDGNKDILLGELIFYTEKNWILNVSELGWSKSVGLMVLGFFRVFFVNFRSNRPQKKFFSTCCQKHNFLENTSF